MKTPNSSNESVQRSHLKTSQKDEFFLWMQEVSLQPSEFEWHLVRDTSDGVGAEVVGERLVHTPSGYYFLFLDASGSKPAYNIDRKYSGPHSFEFSPAAQHGKSSSKTLNWEMVLVAFREWMECLKEELETPDLWRQLLEGGLPILKSDVNETDTFSPEEVRQLDQNIDYLNSQVREHSRGLGLSKEDADWLVGEFEELKSFNRTANKKQWTYSLVGILVAFSFQVAYDPDRTRQLFELVGQAFNWLVEFSHLLSR